MVAVKQLAAVILETGKQVELRRVNIPKPGPGQVLLKIKIACMNPIDRKMAEYAVADGAFQKGKVHGSDVAGVVVDKGPDAGTFVKIGDRVAGFVYGATQTDNGAFAEYCVCRADLCFPIPDDMSDEEGSQLSIPLLTACQILYQSLGFSMPPQPAAPKRTVVLVNGATSTVGAYTIQLAKLAGLTVFATASKEKFAFAKSMGADAVYDYKDPELVKKVQDGTFGNLKYIVDAISDYGTEKLMADLLAEEGGKIAIIRPLQKPREGVELVHSLTYDFLIDRTTAPRSYLNDGPYYAALAKKYLAEGKIKTMPWKVVPGGLSAINDMFKEYAEGKVRGVKYVLRISDTPELYQQLPLYAKRPYF